MMQAQEIKKPPTPEPKKITCPECGQEISHLLWNYPLENKHEFYGLDEKGNVIGEWIGEYPEVPAGKDYNEYTCPFCGAVLARDEKTADSILKGKLIPKLEPEIEIKIEEILRRYWSAVPKEAVKELADLSHK